jgi:hypothetical protein
VLTVVFPAWRAWKHDKTVALFAIAALVLGTGSTTANPVWFVIRSALPPDRRNEP